MINVAVASAQRELARKLRTCLVEWGYRPWEMERDISLQFQLQDRGCDVLLLDLETPIGKNPAAAAQVKKTPKIAIWQFWGFWARSKCRHWNLIGLG